MGAILTLLVKAEAYARMVTLDFDGMEQCLFTGNFFDLRPGEEKEIVRAPFALRQNQITISHWNGEM